MMQNIAMIAELVRYFHVRKDYCNYFIFMVSYIANVNGIVKKIINE